MGILYKKKTSNVKQKTLVTEVSPTIEQHLDSGLAVPIRVVDGEFLLNGGTDEIEQDIRIILNTPVGRHFCQPDFGSLLRQLLDEEADTPLYQALIQATGTALSTWMTDITVLSVQIDDSQIGASQIGIVIRYQINGTNIVNTLALVLDRDENTVFDANVFEIGGNPVFTL